MNYFKCDICKKETMVNPPVERLMDEKEIEVEIPYTVEDPKTKQKKLVYKNWRIIIICKKYSAIINFSLTILTQYFFMEYISEHLTGHAM